MMTSVFVMGERKCADVVYRSGHLRADTITHWWYNMYCNTCATIQYLQYWYTSTEKNSISKKNSFAKIFRAKCLQITVWWDGWLQYMYMHLAYLYLFCVSFIKLESLVSMQIPIPRFQQLGQLFIMKRQLFRRDWFVSLYTVYIHL
jgi:hypothetical protein